MRASPDLLRQLPPIDDLVNHIEDSPDDYISRAFEQVPLDLDESLAGGPRGILPILPETMPSSGAEIERRGVIEAGARGLRKLQDEGRYADLEPDEAFALEAIVHIEGRPAIFVQEGRFFPPPSAWQVLEDAREGIENTIKSVGRIEVSGHHTLDWLGTGFLVGPGVVMTNRHVAEEFCHTLNGRKWRFKSGMGGAIDYLEELGAVDSAEYAVSEVIGVHRDFDLALLRVEQTSGSQVEAPQVLSVAATAPSALEGRPVYTIGYPAWDGRRNDPQHMMRIFANVFGVKRLQPGEVTEVRDAESLFIHDCSTLGGNSGSCVIDLESHQVIGLHFGGRYLQGNYAVALWRLVDDPLLRRAGVQFT